MTEPQKVTKPPNPLEPSPEKEPNKKDEEDEEGLRKSGYDVILCGTNLIHSILASALSLANKRILHCDGADYYGEVDASMDLKGLLEWAEMTAGDQNQEDASTQEEIMGKDLKEKWNPGVKLNPKGSWSGVRIHSFSSIQSNNEETEKEKVENHIENVVQTPYGKGTIQKSTQQSTSSLHQPKIISLDTWTLADGHSHPLLHTVEDYPYANEVDDNNENDEVNLVTESLSQSRRFILDLSTRGPLLFANDKAVRGLISSNVAEYLEFQSVKSLHVILSSNNSSSTRVKTSTKFKSKVKKINKLDLDVKKNLNKQGESKNECNKEQFDSLSFHRVPCSKGDVFQTKLLSPLEKRKLMKLLQLISDYGISVQEQEYQQQYKQQQMLEQSSTEVEKDAEPGQNTETTNSEVELTSTLDESVENQAIQSLNERKLNHGRSLSRPQNKSISTESLQELKSILADSNDPNSNNVVWFHSYLQNTLKLSPRLTHLILYSLALQTISTENEKISTPLPDVSATFSPLPTSLQDGITALVQHLHSLGRFGTTAFLTPLYGIGELSQSFCRSSAVHGGVFLLRRCPLEIVCTGNDELAKGSEKKNDVEKKILGVRLRGDPDTEMVKHEKVVKSRHIVVSNAALFTKTSTKSVSRVLKRISIVHGRFPNLEINATSKSPSSPEDLDGQPQIIIIPPMTESIGNRHAIQGVVQDQTTNVAPENYTVFSLCTIIEGDESNNDSILKRAIDLILYKINAKLEKDGISPLTEVHHVCFSTVNDIKSDGVQQNSLSLLDSQKNIHVSPSQSQSLTVEQAFQEAERIFHSIISMDDEDDAENDQKALKFLKICPALLKIREEQRNIGYGDMDEDDEKVALESALNLIETQ